MPLVNIQIMEGRSQEKIDALMQNVTETVSESLDAPKKNVRVIVNEVPKTHWSIGGTSAKDLGR
ncbi:4-oxalocrotonate tautomerase [Lentibacillus amyloliquefaciens]|uniref:Tautomerase n=1 Tax=Lentibacillus amyloliquefaciens TaxID=1472767 RepID=A0A0U4GBT1_9BACI|nr:4-oxalocrotonate tautomerase [Lentibacillus amyloliquefaciens]ALX50170.1 4-oxalocrotonate tautomerase [Lentibacillus amyloliquefaciens]